MTRTDVLVRLLAEDGPQRFGNLRAVTGWSEGRLCRALDVARGPLGPLRRDWAAGGWVYRLATDEERCAAARQVRPRGVKPGSRWSVARRGAHSSAGGCGGPLAC